MSAPALPDTPSAQEAASLQPPAALAAYTKGPRLRVAINHGNVILAGRDAQGHAQGISVDLARRLAKALDVQAELVEFDRAVDVSGSANDDVWDVGFLAVDPARATEILFTPAYIAIEGNYLLRAGLAARKPSDVAEQMLRIGAVEGSAYALHLSRGAGAAGLILHESFAAMVAALDGGKLDGIAGIKQAMIAMQADRPDAVLITPPFMEIRHAMALPQKSAQAQGHLTLLLRQWAQDGALAAILERHGVDAAAMILDLDPL